MHTNTKSNIPVPTRNKVERIARFGESAGTGMLNYLAAIKDH